MTLSELKERVEQGMFPYAYILDQSYDPRKREYVLTINSPVTRRFASMTISESDLEMGLPVLIKKARRKMSQ